jgi:hypothetical protein
MVMVTAYAYAFSYRLFPFDGLYALTSTLFSMGSKVFSLASSWGLPKTSWALSFHASGILHVDLISAVMPGWKLKC